MFVKTVAIRRLFAMGKAVKAIRGWMAEAVCVGQCGIDESFNSTFHTLIKYDQKDTIIPCKEQVCSYIK